MSVTKIIINILWIFFSYIANAQTITTYVGNGTAGMTLDNILAITAKVRPTASGFDGFGNYYFSQQNSNMICKVDSSGILHIVAGNSSPGYNGDGILATSAELNSPDGIAFDSLGNLYIADRQNFRVRKVDVTTGIITTFAGNGMMGDSGDNSLAIYAKLIPIDIRFDSKGNLYITDAWHNKIRKVSPSGIVSTYAGTGISGYNGDNIPSSFAQLASPAGLAIDKLDNLYVADNNNRRIRKIDTSGIITTIAGAGNNGSLADSIPAINAHVFPYGLWVDDSFNIFLGDTLNKIRKINTVGIINTVAGNGNVGYNGDGIPALTAELYYPGFPAIDVCGNMYFGDGFNYRIRKVWFNTDTLPHVNIAITPNDTVITGTQVTTTATATNHGTITSYQWVKNGANASTNSAYTYTPVNGDSVYCIVTVRACTGRMYTDTTTAIHLTVTGDAGVANTTNSTIHTYPNPVTDVLHVATTEPQHYVLHNLMGVTLLQGSVDKQNSIDMKAIPAGIYLLQLTNTQGQREVVRVVKE